MVKFGFFLTSIRAWRVWGGAWCRLYFPVDFSDKMPYAQRLLKLTQSIESELETGYLDFSSVMFSL